jgi:hypothetical protein
MVIRQAIQCISCDSKFVTRTQVGHKDQQKHSFPCPQCGIAISYQLELDQKTGKSKFRDPQNAKWVDSEEGARTTLTFSDEILVPVDMGGMFSPHVSTFGNYEDFDGYRKDEGLRQLFVSKHFQWAERCRIHFEKGNWLLFDKESPPTSPPATVHSRLVDLYNLLNGGFSKFTLNSRAKQDRILQRLTYAEVSSPAVFSTLAGEFLSSGRILRLWREVAAVRRSFVENYDRIQPIYQIYYWRKTLQRFDDFKLSDNFDSLKQVYIDIFETTCRLLVAGIGLEVIIAHKSIRVPTRKGDISLDEFEALANANKREHLEKYPIADLFVPVIDTGLRNGLGHHSAHFDKESDQIVLYNTKKGAVIQQKLGYTEFCDRVVKLFAAFELAVMYHNGLHLWLRGKFQ